MHIIKKIESSLRQVKSSNVDIWSVNNKGIFIQGSQKITFEKLSQPCLDPQEDAKLKKACQDFESFFLYYLLKQMRQTIPQGGIWKQTRALEFYRDMFDEQIADCIAKSKGIGLSQMLYDKIKQSLIKKTHI